MKTTFITPNGITVEGTIIYSSPLSRSSKDFVNKVYDEIVYAQNRIVKIHHTLAPNDMDDYEEYGNPEITILSEYAVIPELDKHN